MSTVASLHRGGRLVRFGAAVILTLALVAPTAATAAVSPVRADLDDGTFNPFSQTNASTGTLTLDASNGYGPGGSARATYSGGGANGYARGIFNVDWQEGDDVWYGSAFYLPVGFKASMQGQVALMRWDNWQSHPTGTDHGGIALFGSDKRARFYREQLSGGGQEVLGSAFDLPEGRWFWLETHQRLSSSGSGVTEVYLDGRLVAQSTAPNFYAGRPVERIRYGIVAIAAGKQMNPLSLSFDRSTVSTGAVGPVAGLEGPAPDAGTTTTSTGTTSTSTGTTSTSTSTSTDTTSTSTSTDTTNTSTGTDSTTTTTTTTTSSSRPRKSRKRKLQRVATKRCSKRAKVRKARSPHRKRVLRKRARRCRIAKRRAVVKLAAVRAREATAAAARS